MSDHDFDNREDPTLGFRSNLDGTFADAEVRMKQRIAASIASSETPPRTELDRAVGSEPLRSYVPVEPRGRRPKHRRRVVAATAILAGVVLVVGLVWGRSISERVFVPTVERLAQAASETPSAPFSLDQPVEFDLVRIEPRDSATVSQRSHTILNVDGTGQVTADAEILTSGDPATPLAAASTNTITSDPVVAGFTYPELMNLPAEPDVMKAAVVAVLGSDEPSAVAEVLAWAASTAPATPDIRAAAVTALGDLSTSNPAMAQDPLGRKGVELAGSGWSVLVDPADGAVLAFGSSGANGVTWTLWQP